MQLFDISKQLTAAPLYPGDPAPVLTHTVERMDGEICRVSSVSMVLHTGTHADAPLHFYPGGKGIDQMPLDCFVGDCFVLIARGPVSAETIWRNVPVDCERLLIKEEGSADLTLDGARYLAGHGFLCVGVETVSVGGEKDTPKVHRVLCENGVAILENLDLSQIAQGSYFLSAPPLKIQDSDGAPVRAILIKK